MHTGIQEESHAPRWNSVKTRTTIWTQEKRAAVRENAEKYAWAKQQVEAVTARAEVFAEAAERLYGLIAGEGLPRYYHMGHTLDPEIFYCRYCRSNIGARGHYPWIVRPLEEPWKITCPDCGRRFPSNDFGGFYRLGLDEHGIFNHAQALRKNAESRASGGPDYLKNELYPEKGEGWGVDDGFGYYTGRVYENGVRERHNYIATYLDRGLWGGSKNGVVADAIHTLAEAYAYTGEAKYGRAGAMLLDRMADLYPDFNWYQWAAFRGSENFRGKIFDAIGECGFARYLACAYDAFFPIYDDPVLIACLREKSLRFRQENPKDCAGAIRANVENGILREIYRACQNGSICGNFGMAQTALTAAAVCLDAMPETGFWLDWVMRPGQPNNQGDPFQNPPIEGGDLLGVLLDRVDRNGMGDEASPDYNGGWLFYLMDLAELLRGYDRYPDTDLYQNPKFTQMFTAQLPLMMADYYTAQIADCGATAGAGFKYSLETALLGFRRLGGVRLAQWMYHRNGDSADGLHGDITDSDPSAVGEAIRELVRIHGSWQPGSEMMTGYGFAALRDGEKNTPLGNTLRDFTLYFGIGDGHGHADALNLGIDAFGLNMAPDLGYPEVTGTQPNRLQWVRGTLSHNTVTVDRYFQKSLTAAGTPLHFDDAGPVKLMDAEAGRAYPQTRAYRRSVVMVEAGPDVSYGVDFFRVCGGDDHLYSFHAQSNTIFETQGLELIPQADESGRSVGSYAGPEVPWGPDPGTVETSWSLDTLQYPPGETWLYDVRRDAAPDHQITVDFQISDFRRVLPEEQNLHLRLTMPNDFPLDEAALALAWPPRASRPFIPELEYFLARRSGENLNTLFTTVFEPYRNSRFIADGIESVPVEVMEGAPSPEDAVKAVKIPLRDGRIDYVVYATNPAVKYRVGGLFDFRGFIGVYSLRDGEAVLRYLCDGDTLDGPTGQSPAWTGRVTDFTRGLEMENHITVTLEQAVNPAVLREKYVYIENDGVQNGVYHIIDARENGAGEFRLELGPVSLIRDREGGHNIIPGQRLRIPLSWMEQKNNHKE